MTGKVTYSHVDHHRTDSVRPRVVPECSNLSAGRDGRGQLGIGGCSRVVAGKIRVHSVRDGTS